jgi:hypothetical protein
MDILDNEQLAAPQDNHAAEPAMATQVGAVSAVTLAARAAIARAAVLQGGEGGADRSRSATQGSLTNTQGAHQVDSERNRAPADHHQDLPTVG